MINAMHQMFSKGEKMNKKKMVIDCRRAMDELLAKKGWTQKELLIKMAQYMQEHMEHVDIKGKGGPYKWAGDNENRFSEKINGKESRSFSLD